MPPQISALKSHTALRKTKPPTPNPINHLHRNPEPMGLGKEWIGSNAVLSPTEYYGGMFCQAGLRPSQSSLGIKISGVPFPIALNFGASMCSKSVTKLHNQHQP